MTQCTYGNGLVDTRSYDLQGRMTDQQLGTNTNSIDHRTYNYDANSNMLSRLTTAQNSLYQYDALDRLIGDQINDDQSLAFDYRKRGRNYFLRKRGRNYFLHR